MSSSESIPLKGRDLTSLQYVMNLICYNNFTALIPVRPSIFTDVIFFFVGGGSSPLRSFFTFS